MVNAHSSHPHHSACQEIEQTRGNSCHAATVSLSVGRQDQKRFIVVACHDDAQARLSTPSCVQDASALLPHADGGGASSKGSRCLSRQRVILLSTPVTGSKPCAIKSPDKRALLLFTRLVFLIASVLCHMFGKLKHYCDLPPPPLVLDPCSKQCLVTAAPTLWASTHQEWRTR